MKIGAEAFAKVVTTSNGRQNKATALSMTHDPSNLSIRCFTLDYTQQIISVVVRPGILGADQIIKDKI